MEKETSAANPMAVRNNFSSERNQENEVSRFERQILAAPTIVNHRKEILHGNADALLTVENYTHHKKTEKKEGLGKPMRRQTQIEVLRKWNITQLIKDQKQDEDILPILEAKSTG